MKNKILAALTIVSCVLLIGCGEAKPLFDGHDVRNSNWGDSLEDVKSSESIDPDVDSSNRLTYADKFLDYNCNITYSFLQDQLCEMDIDIYPEDDQTIEDIYKDVDKQLEKSYGEATADYDTFKCYRDDKSDIWVTQEAEYVSIKFGRKIEDIVNNQ